MFKFTRVFLVFQMLPRALCGAELCCPEVRNALTAVKLDNEISVDLVKDIRAKLGESFEWPPSRNALCLPGFTYLPSAGSCYKVVYESHDWYSAGRRCQAFGPGSRLTAVTSATENQALKTFLASELSTLCLSGFTYLPSAESCYKVVYESHDWYSAGKTCQALGRGSHLVAITSATENQALKTFLASELSKNVDKSACIPIEAPLYGELFWTSGQRVLEDDCTSRFVWKPSSYERLPVVFTNWKTGEPNCGVGGHSHVESCLHFWAKENFDWNDIKCSQKFCPLCEYKP